MSSLRQTRPAGGGQRRLIRALLVAVALPVASLHAASGAETAVPRPEIRLAVEEIRLENGLSLLLVDRPESPEFAAGWVTRSGSADDPADRRGLAHVLEHMMFKGSRIIGSRDYPAEKAYESEAAELRTELEKLRARGRGAGRRALELAERIADLDTQRRELLRLGEFALRYSEAGASGLNAFTFEDFTLFFVRLPAAKLELWFWLESDRLSTPVFREFSKEKAVIRQEVGQRIAAAPTGRADAEVRRAFWGDSSYAWRPLGRDEDLEAVEGVDAERFFRRHYRPENLTAVLVGPFGDDLDHVKQLAETYLGRLRNPPPTASQAPPRRTRPATPAPDAHFETSCECPSQARVLYPSVPFRHADSYALQVLAGVLNGRTGRLYRGLVLEDGIAFSASAAQLSLRDAGRFVFSAETKGEATPEDLVAAWEREIDELRRMPVGAAELQKVKNQLIASSLRGLRRPSDLARQLLVYAGLGDWRQIEDWPRRVNAVSAEELRTAARKLSHDSRLVALYRGTAQGSRSR